jgi:hypothetical protein
MWLKLQLSLFKIYNSDCSAIHSEALLREIQRMPRGQFLKEEKA